MSCRLVDKNDPRNLTKTHQQRLVWISVIRFAHCATPKEQESEREQLAEDTKDNFSAILSNLEEAVSYASRVSCRINSGH